MELVYKMYRAVAIPCRPTCVDILVKNLTTSCGNNRGDGKDQDGEPIPSFSHFCPCCNCPCGTNPPPNMYDSRKYGHCLPGNTNMPCFPILPQIPADVFRCTTGEALGPQGQASKCCLYLNPEYFSFHHMSYYDMHIALRSYRQPSAKTGRKPL